jgi:hypothetical protein
MDRPAIPYNLNDVLLLLGQCTVELAYLRARIAELEAHLAAETSEDGRADVPEAMVKSA